MGRKTLLWKVIINYLHIPRWNHWFQVRVCERSLGIPPPKKKLKNHWLKPILSCCLPHIVLSPLHISFYLRRMFVLYLKTLQANDIHKLLQDSTYTDAFTTLFCLKIKYNVPPMLFILYIVGVTLGQRS